MLFRLDGVGMDSVHVDSADRSKPVAKKSKRKMRKASAVGPPLEKKSRRRSRRGLNMKIHPDGTMHVRHMTNDDKCIAVLPGVEITEQEEPVTMSDAGQLKWNKLAIPGIFRGHPTGPFEMNSKVFSEIERNFKNSGCDVVFDYEHAAEISVSDSPAKAAGDIIASGWIKEVQARPDGLYGLVEWTDKARERIRNKEIKYISPAIRFGAKDPKTGQPIGAKLSSAALCLKPFLSDLPQALASDSEYTAILCSEISPEDVAVIGSELAISENEYLPEFRKILGLHEMCSLEEICDRVIRLSDLCEMADGDTTAVVQGVKLSDYVPKIREFMRMPVNTTQKTMFEAIIDMIRAVMDHEEAEEEAGMYDDEDSEGVEMSETVSVPSQKTDDAPAPVITKETKIVMDTILLTEHAVKLTEAVNAAVAEAKAPLTLQIKEHESAVAKAMSDLAAAEAKVLELTDQIKARDAAVAATRVEEAFATYKDTKKLTDDDKEAMAITLSTKPELFEKLYPKMTVEKATLLKAITATDDTRPNAAAGFKTVPDLAAIISDVKAKNPGITDFDKIFDMALKEQATLMAG